MKIKVSAITLFCLLCTITNAFAVKFVPDDAISTESVTELEYVGQGIAAIGDINGDFKKEIAIGAPRYNASFSWGAVYIPYIDVDGPVIPQIDLTKVGTTVPGLMIYGQATGSLGHYIGEGICSLGDLDGDKMSETVFTERTVGDLMIFFGNKNLTGRMNLDQLSAATKTIEITNIPVAEKMTVACGDVNGDGKKDLYFSYGQNGESALIYVNQLAPGKYTLASLLDGVNGSKFKFNYASATSVQVKLIDLNKDGMKDMVASEAITGFGYRIPGKATKYAGTNNIDDAWLTANGGTRFVSYGSIGIVAVKDPGDVNCDGYDDVAFRGEIWPSQFPIRIEYGRATWPTIINISSTLADKTDGFTIRNFGRASTSDSDNIIRGGDRNGDGCKDFLVGDNTFQSGNGRIVYLNAQKTDDWGTAFDMNNMSSLFGEQYFGKRIGYFGTAIAYDENMGLGCSGDNYMFGAEPGYSNVQGKVYQVPIKK